jgi:hypothetical protein
MSESTKGVTQGFPEKRENRKAEYFCVQPLYGKWAV